MAGSGQGNGQESLDDAARQRWRQQALEWLRADLARYAELLPRAPADARAQSLGQLQNWQRDPDLAGVREAESLAKRPEAEREAWAKLWEEVAELLKQGSRE